jgi:hypothetical protein
MRVVVGRNPLGQLQNLPQELNVILSNTQLAHDGDLCLAECFEQSFSRAALEARP